ncbi:MAG: InlB B-repeat-containing protein, partial [Clostridiaceae bacterium]|nr:InlB B-repeat-containing protein [Clostridiaceae bacterium]MDY5890319.1 InlB B-repeat-containing protein [Oscillospiraceae bacterium]
MPLEVIADNKETLRTAVEKAKNNFAVLGIYNNSYSSYYFTSTAYTNFVNLYKDAERYLTAVDLPLSSVVGSSYSSASALAEALENALKTLLEGNSLATKTAYQYNVGLRPTSNGTYELISFSTKQLDYTARENVTFTPDSTCLGYNNYLGSTKVTSAQGSTFTNTGASVCSISNNLDSIKSTLISSSNTKQYSSTISGSILTIGNPNSEHTTKPKTVSATSSGYASEITYNYTAAAKDIAIYMISFYVGNTYTVNYNLNGGTAETNAPTSATYDVPFAVSPPTRSGYKFVGWTVTSGLNTSTAKYGNTSSPSTALSSSTTKCYNTSNSTGSDVYFSNLTPTNNGSVTLTANWIPILDLNWRFNGTANNNGDKSKAVAIIEINETEVATGVADFYDGVEPGSKVKVYVTIKEDGWSFTNPKNPPNGNYIEFDMPTTTYSVIPELCSKYTVVFNGNGYTGGSTDSQEFVWGDAQDLNANGFVKEGYTFASWNTAADGSGTSYSDKQNVNSLTTDLNGTINLYAQWTANTYKVKYNGNGATSGSTETSTHTYDIAKNLTANGYKREYTVTYNYNGSGAANTTATATATFNGWATSAAGAKVYNNGQSVINLSTGADVNLYANWTLSTVTLPNPTRTGYTFGGWYSEPACTNFVANGGATYTPTSTLTLYAKWTANKYTVTFDQQNGSGGSASVQATYDKAMPAATMPSRTGYTFKGYFTGTNGTGTQYYNADGTSKRNWDIAEAKTLYAYWTNNTYTVTLNQQNGTGGTASVQATYDKAMPAATMPSRTGYIFGGYYSGTNGTGTQYY